MPDKRKHRGKHPQDDRLFAPDQLPALRSATIDLAMLLTRGYADKSALKLVGDRYDLTARQRMAVWRSSCSDQALEHRRHSQVSAEQARGARLGIDGYNLLITVESALSGGLVTVGRDGCYRDLASIHGTYRKVEETEPALHVIFDHLAGLAASHIDWYLDRPVSNSARLKTLMAQLLEQKPGRGSVNLTSSTPWNIELVNNPDTVLIEYDGIAASADSLVLDSCRQWTSLAAQIVNTRVDNPWTLDLRETSTP